MSLMIKKWVKISPQAIILNGIRQDLSSEGKKLLVEAYRKTNNDYPKFFKMDSLCRLGYVASELLLQDDPHRFTPREDCAVIMFNRSSSIATDCNYQQTIGQENYFPSPSVFVYTLPNIVTGEICIRNKYYGESSFYVLDECNVEDIIRIVSHSFSDRITDSVMCGWLESYSDNEFEAVVLIVQPADFSTATTNEFNKENFLNINNI